MTILEQTTPGTSASTTVTTTTVTQTGPVMTSATADVKVTPQDAFSLHHARWNTDFTTRHTPTTTPTGTPTVTPTTMPTASQELAAKPTASQEIGATPGPSSKPTASQELASTGGACAEPKKRAGVIKTRYQPYSSWPQNVGDDEKDDDNATLSSRY